MATSKYVLASVNLFDIRIDIDSLDDLPSDVVPTYDVAVTKPDADGKVPGRFLFEAHVTIGKRKPKDKHNAIQIAGSYGCAVDVASGSVEIAEEAAHQYAALNVWPAFLALFGVVTQQMRLNFPPLPAIAAKVQTREVVYIDDASGSKGVH